MKLELQIMNFLGFTIKDDKAFKPISNEYVETYNFATNLNALFLVLRKISKSGYKYQINTYETTEKNKLPKDAYSIIIVYKGEPYSTAASNDKKFTSTLEDCLYSGICNFMKHMQEVGDKLRENDKTIESV